MAGSGSIQLRIKKDSAIWMVGKKFSVEGIRTFINKDSFFILNRLEKTFIAESISETASTFGIELSFEDLQELFVGNMFIPTETEISSFAQKEEKVKLIANTQSLNTEYTFNAYDMTLEQVNISDRSGHSIVMKLGNYKKIKKQLIAHDKEISFSSITGDSGQLSISFTEIELDIEKSLIFDLPLRYKRIRL
jgi:hypothetical protein